MAFVGALPNQPACVAQFDSVDDPQLGWEFKYFDASPTSYRIDKVEAPGVTYPLRRKLKATFLPGTGEFFVDEFYPLFIGHGETKKESHADWASKIHCRFQELLTTRPFEMTQDDRSAWNALSEHIDVTVYRNQTPLRVKQYGKISFARPYPTHIEWEDGRSERVSPAMVDADDFITYKFGQPFEAVAIRHPVTFDLIRLVYIKRRSEARRLPASVEASVLSRIGSSDRLGETSWD